MDPEQIEQDRRRLVVTDPAPAKKLDENELLRYDNYSLRVHNAQLLLAAAQRDWMAYCQRLSQKYETLVDHTTLKADGTLIAGGAATIGEMLAQLGNSAEETIKPPSGG